MRKNGAVGKNCWFQAVSGPFCVELAASVCPCVGFLWELLPSSPMLMLRMRTRDNLARV